MQSLYLDNSKIKSYQKRIWSLDKRIRSWFLSNFYFYINVTILRTLFRRYLTMKITQNLVCLWLELKTYNSMIE